MPKREAESEPVDEPAAKKAKTTKPEYTFNFNKAVDKAQEVKTFTDLKALPPSALQGLTERGDVVFAKVKIQTIEDLGRWKYYHIAKAIKTLAETEEEGARNPEGDANLNSALDKEWETKTFNEMLNAPISALQGLGDWVDGAFKELRPAPKTIGELADWKYCHWAEAITTLSLYETEDHSSR